MASLKSVSVKPAGDRRPPWSRPSMTLLTGEKLEQAKKILEPKARKTEA